MGFSLKDLLGRAGQVVSKGANNLENNARNFVQSTNKEAAQLVRQPWNLIPGVGLANNLKNQQAARGTIQSASKDYGYTPYFNELANSVSADKGGFSQSGARSGVVAQYNPGNNLVSFDENIGKVPGSPDQYATHELLHADYQRQSPQQQKSFLELLNNNADPQLRKSLSSQLNSETYGNYQLPQDLRQVPQNIATELHSYTPGYSKNPQLQNYYSKYFNPQAATARSQYAPDKFKAITIGSKAGAKFPWGKF